MRIVIIGNGIAGTEAAMHLARQRVPFDISLVSEESDYCFARTALMWVCAGQLGYRDIEPFDRSAYEGMRRIRGRVSGLDVRNRTVLLADGLPPLAYDKLLIASGCRPRPLSVPGTDLAGVGHFVSLQDLAWMQQELGVDHALTRPPPAQGSKYPNTGASAYAPRTVAAARKGHSAGSMCVVGGGLVGCEAVELALHHGLTTRFIMRDSHVFSAALLPQEGRLLSALLARHGVQVEAGGQVEAFEGDDADCVRAVLTNHARHDCDVAVVAIGVLPNSAFLDDSGLAFAPGGAVLVDEFQRTSAPDVYAAGDCAAVPDGVGGHCLRQSWYTARDQGRVAARAMMGEKARYDPGVPYDSAKMMDVEFTSVGTLQADAVDAYVLHEESGAVCSTTRLALSDGRVVGFAGLGRRWDHTVIAQLIRAARPLPWVLERLTEAAFDTEFVPPLRLPRNIPVCPQPAARGAHGTEGRS